MKAAELITKFQTALDDKWGYIWGTAGDLWTEAKQKQKIDYMVSKYGTSWKKNSEAKDDHYYEAATTGSKWVGHNVADCSGLFKWAFSLFKVYIAHGSNSIWKQYCSAQGKLISGKRSDGSELLPGTAVFTDHNGDKTHIGLYIGKGKVIEACSTDSGVCMSNVSATKWKCWGELKNVAYPGQPEPQPGYPTLKRGSKGEDVKKAQTILLKLGYDLGSWGVDGDFGKATEAAVKAFQKDHALTSDGVIGAKTWEALVKANEQISGVVKSGLYTVRIPHLDKTQATAIMTNYPGAAMTEE